jgi:5-methylcytosine-specific restriction endonuclease McrA
MLRVHVGGLCDRCGSALPRLRKRWCSDECSRWAYLEFAKQHDWNAAREAAMKRDGRKCVKCGDHHYPLQVNHIVPRNAQGYGRGCHHHLSNLETLCRRCHTAVTNEQRRARVKSTSPLAPLSGKRMKGNAA